MSGEAKPRKDYVRHVIYNRGYKAAARGRDTDTPLSMAPKRPAWKRAAWLQGYKAGLFRKDAIRGLSMLFGGASE